jgi:hypothetical protein
MADDFDNEPEADGRVPYARFKAVNEARKQAIDEGAKAATARDAALKAAAQHEAERARWSVERDALRAGITDEEGLDVALMFYDRLPRDKRPTMGEWLASLRADPATAPRALAAYLPTTKATSTTPPATTPPTPTPTAQPFARLPNESAGHTGGGPPASEADLRAAHRSGDPAKMRSALEAFYLQRGIAVPAGLRPPK